LNNYQHQTQQQHHQIHTHPACLSLQLLLLLLLSCFSLYKAIMQLCVCLSLDLFRCLFVQKHRTQLSELLLRTQRKVNSGDWTRNALSQLSAMKIRRAGSRIDTLEGSNNFYPWSLVLLRQHCDEICVGSNRCMVEETARNVFRVSNPTKQNPKAQ
jgi:hypothetical protein